MKKEWADKWVKALRSGQYKQGKKTLKNHDGTFCCLGVLCDISAIAEWIPYWDKFKYIDSSSCLPGLIMNLTGMKTQTGTLVDGSLVELNDDKSFSFSQIADVIEKRWEEL